MTREQLNGIIVIDKPADISSAKALAEVKKILQVKKAGHTGTLDPFATGVMICCINDATRLAGFFLNSYKTYRATVHLGVETDTQDFTGTVTATHDVGDYDDQIIADCFYQFLGSRMQYPPVFSALKHNGIPLYKLARSGKPVQKPPRQVNIASINVLDIHLPLIDFEVSCSAGTYIRTLCADIGKALDCGGHLKQLRRMSSSGFTLDDAVTLSELRHLADSENLHQKLISMSDALGDMPEYIADANLSERVRNGITLTGNDIPFPPTDSPCGHLKVVGESKNLLGVLSYNRNSCIYHYCCVFRA